MEKCASFINILTGNGGSYYVVTYIRLFLFNVLWIISKINLSYHLFLLWSNSGHPVKQLYNVIEILFYFKLDTPFEIEYQVHKKEHVQLLLSFNQDPKTAREIWAASKDDFITDRMVQKWLPRLKEGVRTHRLSVFWSTCSTE